jgi:hypothetical protein
MLPLHQIIVGDKDKISLKVREVLFKLGNGKRTIVFHVWLSHIGHQVIAQAYRRLWSEPSPYRCGDEV